MPASLQWRFVYRTYSVSSEALTEASRDTSLRLTRSMRSVKEKTVAETVAQALAKHGEKMVEVRVRFWTNDIADDKGKVVPKHAWSGGVVRTERNEAHGIVPKPPIVFNSLGHLPDAIERCLIANGIKLHPGGRDANLFAVTDTASGAPAATRAKVR